MRPQHVVHVLTVVILGFARAQGGEFTFSRHIASGWGTAQVFDGGPPVTDSDAITLGNASRMSFAADDATRSGSRGAVAQAFGRSIVGTAPDALGIEVVFRATYDPSLFEDGDRPGGTSEGKLSSLIEFEIPARELIWFYVFDVDRTGGYSGSSSLLVENVTQSEVLLNLISDSPVTEARLAGRLGDLIRITTDIQGSGSATSSALTHRQYGTVLNMTFRVPEPSALLLFALGTYIVMHGRFLQRLRAL